MNNSEKGLKEKKFKEYFLMNEDDVIDYFKYRFNFFERNAQLNCKEIGDGNINYIFRIVNELDGKSVIVKQAGMECRTGGALTIERGKIETDVMKLEEKYAKGLVPKIYYYDDIMKTIIMEDMIDHELLRTGLIKHKIYNHFSDDITTFLVNTLFMTSDLVMDHKEKKKLVCHFINPDLCAISEKLVYTEPFEELKENNVFPDTLPFAREELYNDEKLKLEVAKLKFEFMNNAQSLIHGDLHSGSVFINQNHTFVFDSEFAFYGPMGYDIGNVIANLFFAWVNGDSTIENTKERESFCNWILHSIFDIVDKFIDKFKKSYEINVNDKMAKVPGFMEYYLSGVLSDSAGVAGLELIRRVGGKAKVKDITCIGLRDKRLRAEKIILNLGKQFIFKRKELNNGADYRELILKNIKKFS